MTNKHIEYIKLGLKESLKDKQEFSQQEFERITSNLKRLQDRINKLYIDKLDGLIDNEFWKEKNTLWSNELSELENKLHAYNVADKKYYEEGIKILELLKNAYGLYSKQNNVEKRKMLNYLLSNCKLSNKKVSYD